MVGTPIFSWNFWEICLKNVNYSVISNPHLYNGWTKGAVYQQGLKYGISQIKLFFS